jgi:hypothetical protein
MSRGALKAATVPAMCDSMAARATSGFRDLMAVLMKSWSWFRFGTELESCWMPPIVVTRKSERSHIRSLRFAITRDCDIEWMTRWYSRLRWRYRRARSAGSASSSRSAMRCHASSRSASWASARPAR